MKAEGALTDTAVEMDMLVVWRAVVMALAQLILRNPCTILDGVNQMVLQQEGQGAKDGGTIDGFQFIVQLTQRTGMAMISQRPINEDARGSGFYATSREMVFNICLGHFIRLIL